MFLEGKIMRGKRCNKNIHRIQKKTLTLLLIGDLVIKVLPLFRLALSGLGMAGQQQNLDLGVDL